MMAIFKKKRSEKPDSGETEDKQKWFQSSGTYFRLLFTPGYTIFDVFLLVGGVIGAIATGIPFPLLAILYGQLVNDINSAGCDTSTGTNTSSLQSQVSQKALDVIYVTIANWCFIYIHTNCWGLFGERLVRRLREGYLRNLLRQEPAFFDSLPAGDVSARLSVDLEAIQTGTSEKVGICIGSVSYFVAAYVVSFIKDATLAGILVSLVPAYFLMAFVGSYFIKRFAGRVSDQIALATSIASESLDKLNLVQAFSAGPRLEAKFAEYLGEARKEGCKKAVVAAIQLGLLYFIAYSTNALAYWQGSQGIARSVESGNGASEIGAVYTVIFLLIDATFVLSQVAPFLQIFGNASGASDKLNRATARVSNIDGTDRDHGRYLESVDGQVTFEDVSFEYPSRPDTQVLKGISFSIPAFKHTAIVGQSGSGKSTVAALVARLYDPSAGTVTLDGTNVRDLNVRFLRSCIGTVQQDPNLLNRSILENIAHGLINSQATDAEEIAAILDGSISALVEKMQGGSSLEDALVDQSEAVKRVIDRVQEAATTADALNFISRLEHGLATSVGSAGHQMSGGQKQRIALARAMMRRPQILLLDEATSALDSHSERLIQNALQRATQGRTTISIVHRLSTVKNADNIIVMGGGKVLEQGTHEQLLASDGVFASMVRLQNVSHDQDNQLPQALTANESNADPVLPTSGDERSETDFSEQKDPSNANEKEAQTPTEDGKDPKPEDNEADKKRGVFSTIGGIAALTRTQALSLLFAFTASAIVGGSYSGEAVIFGYTVSSFSACDSAASIMSAGHFWGLLFFILAIIEFFANLTMGSMFSLVSENTLYKIRVLSFRVLLGQDVDWHESKGRTPSSQLSVITTDANALAGLTGTVLGTLFSIIINTIAGIILSLIIAWRIAIVLLACIPVLLGSGFMRLRVFAKFHEQHAKAFSGATGFAVEAVNAIKTISVFSLEDEAVNVYHRALKAPYEATLKAFLWSNAWLACSYSVGNLVYALAYWWGTQNIIEGRYSQRDFFIVLPALLFSAQTCGQLFSLAPDFSKSRVSAAKILDLLDLGKDSMTISNKTIHSDSLLSEDAAPEKDLETGSEKANLSVSTPTNGAHVRFRDVEFSYPARPNTQVLRKLDLEMKPGQFCALVGPSGAGKSTIISLIERFYRPSSGAVEIDGRAVSDFDSTKFRDEIALVPQDSVLFEGTLRFNLSLGARPDQDVTDEDIIAACKLAHIHHTIMELPDQYDTRCGPNGNQFSGGQKQRLSIARALLRKPRLLLLDESTSALDSESEKMVQDALESVRHGITTIAIAHRLHTIEKADRIFVIEEGRCTAQGTHHELLQNSETYRTSALHQILGQ